MATFLDAIGTLQEFSIIFTFILILVVVYALLQYTKMLGDNKAIHAIIALAIAFLFLFSQTASEIIKIMVPWFVILFSGILFILMGIKMFGATKEADLDLWSLISQHESTRWWILAISLIIILGAITTVYSEKGRIFGEGGAAEPGASESKYGEAGTVGTTGFWGTITHPKVLGLAAILLIASYAVRYMTKIN